MTGSERVVRRPFTREAVDQLRRGDQRLSNWPVVYTLNDRRDVYVGESLNVALRMRQHLEVPERSKLEEMHVILHQEFNKSACLDLESELIKLFAGDGRFTVLNRNAGIATSNYYDRDRYRAEFNDIFEELRAKGLFQRSIPEIVNSDLFKFSPFKSLNTEQAIAVEDIVEGLLSDIEAGVESTSVIRGDPGTGKTIVAIYLVKLLRDIALARPDDDHDQDSVFSDFFVEGNRDLLRNLRIALVVPQQSLRSTLARVFARIPGLHPSMVLTPFDIGRDANTYDLLIVDEAHRLAQRANMPSAALNTQFSEINVALFGVDSYDRTQLDWLEARSRHRILLVDAEQTVRPADLPKAVVETLIRTAARNDRQYLLQSQMRVQGGRGYIEYVGDVLSDRPVRPEPGRFANYELRFFDDFSQLHEAIKAQDQAPDTGLARLVAGFAWKWLSREDPAAFDIELDGHRVRWNSTQTDWISSPLSVEEMGSIHTVQGYDLNYAGVVIGPDLRFDPIQNRLVFDRSRYFDRKGKENNPRLGITYSDEDVLQYVINIYRVLLTRGIKGTYVYVVDPPLRERLRPFFDGPPRVMPPQE